MTERLVIMSDYGLDDAAATAYLLAHRERFQRITIVAVGGNVSPEKSFANAQKLLAAIGGDMYNIRLLATDFILQRYQELPDIHGSDGMGGIFPQAVSDAKIITYERFLERFDDENATVLSLGSLSVTKDIILKRHVKKLVIMGGLINAVPNFEGLEFNQALDKDAAAMCFSYPHVAATLDTCRDPRFNLIDFKPKGNSAFSRILRAAIESAARRHPDNCYIYDLIASLYITDPEIFVCEQFTDPCGNLVNQLKLAADFDFKRHLNRLCR